ncbi:hypothetical protein AAA450_11715 [Staphylococcus equorum]|uniref:hypothetical protein n=1 Tax=Staphylococcus equorum TaxID=246432 RepID=UPI003D80545D
MEWEIIDHEYDQGRLSTCTCGKRDLHYLYTIRNFETGNVLYPIGSKCIKRFGREDLKEMVNVYDQVMKLVKAKRDGEYINLKCKENYFSKKLIDHLNKQKVFSCENGYDNYEIIKKFFSQRKPLSPKQKRLVTRIIMNDVFGYIDSL